jgi:hypothetical protein
MSIKVYLDSSVVGGCFEDIFREASNRLFTEFLQGKKLALISDLLLLEMEEAPKSVQEKLHSIPAQFIIRISLSKEAIELADAYLKEGIVAEKSISDARHIALASVERADVLVSWNFKHIVNLGRIRQYQAVNLIRGYPLIEIRTPAEVIDATTKD